MSDNNRENNRELSCIYHTNVRTMMSKNNFPIFFPVATALRLSTRGIPIKYLAINNGELNVTEIRFDEALRFDLQRLSEIRWNSRTHPEEYIRSDNPPQIDMVPMYDRRQLLEFVVKLTEVRTGQRRHTTKINLNQNTLFSLAERLVHRYPNLIEGRPGTIETLHNITTDEESQLPFILHGLWKTLPNSMDIDQRNTADVFFISDFAYLKMLLDKFDDNPNSRIGRILEMIRRWIEEFNQRGRIRYREDNSNVEKIDITINPTKHLEELDDSYRNLRLNIEDIREIIPERSRQQVPPERRLDVALSDFFRQDN